MMWFNGFFSRSLAAMFVALSVTTNLFGDVIRTLTWGECGGCTPTGSSVGSESFVGYQARGLPSGATAQVSFALMANTTGATRTYTYTVTGPESYSIVVTQPPTSAKSASAAAGGASVAVTADGGSAESCWEPGYYRGEFVDGSGMFDLLVYEDGAAFFAATTEDGDWSAECEAEIVGETLVLECECGSRILCRQEGLLMLGYLR